MLHSLQNLSSLWVAWMQVVGERLRSPLSGVQSALPLLEALQNPDLKRAHWQVLQGKLQLLGPLTPLDVRMSSLLQFEVSHSSRLWSCLAEQG